MLLYLCMSVLGCSGFHHHAYLKIRVCACKVDQILAHVQGLYIFRLACLEQLPVADLVYEKFHAAGGHRDLYTLPWNRINLGLFHLFIQLYLYVTCIIYIYTHTYIHTYIHTYSKFYSAHLASTCLQDS